MAAVEQTVAQEVPVETPVVAEEQKEETPAPAVVEETPAPAVDVPAKEEQVETFGEPVVEEKKAEEPVVKSKSTRNGGLFACCLAKPEPEEVKVEEEAAPVAEKKDDEVAAGETEKDNVAPGVPVAEALPAVEEPKKEEEPVAA